MNERDLDFNPNLKTKHRLVQQEPDELGRRKWALEHYQQQEGDKVDLGILNKDPRTESFLVGRTQKLAINSKIGRGDALKKTRKDGGFFCEVCHELYKCDSAFLTHLNSASHNRKLGMSLKVESVGPQSIRIKLAGINHCNSALSQKGSSKPSAMEQIVNKASRKNLKLQQKEEQKQLRAEKQGSQILQNFDEKDQQHQNVREPTKQSVAEVQTQPLNESTLEAPDETELMMKAMGLPTSFGGRKRHHN